MVAMRSKLVITLILGTAANECQLPLSAGLVAMLAERSSVMKEVAAIKADFALVFDAAQ